MPGYAKRGRFVTFPLKVPTTEFLSVLKCHNTTQHGHDHCGHTLEVLEPRNSRKLLFTTPWRAGATRLLTGLPASQRSPTAPLRVLLGDQSPGRPGWASQPPIVRLAAPLAGSRTETGALGGAYAHGVGGWMSGRARPEWRKGGA